MKKILFLFAIMASIAVQAKNDKNVGTVTDAELLTMIRNQYENAVATTNLSEISKWHGGVSEQKINTNDWTKTYTYKDGFKFIVKATKREKKTIDKNTKNKIKNRNEDKRIGETKRRIADLERMLANMKQYSLPTEAIKAKLNGDKAYLKKLTQDFKVVTKTIEVGAIRKALDNYLIDELKNPKTNIVETVVADEDTPPPEEP